MALKESRSPAHPEPPRQRLTSPWTLLGVAVAVGVTLVLIFPGGGMLSQHQASKQRPDDVSLTYLGNLAKQEPDNPERRFTLAQKETEVGKVQDARRALAPLYNHKDPAVRQRARLQDFRLQMQEMHGQAPGSGQRAKTIQGLRDELAAMAQYDWPTENLLELAKLANEVGARQIRSDIYLRIAKSGEKADRKWIDQAGKAALSDGEYRKASEIYFTSMERATTTDERKYYFMQGVAALQAGNLPREALNAAERNAGPLLDDDEMLRYMIRLAQASNDPQRAQAYVRRLMRMSERGSISRFLAAVLDGLVPSAIAGEAASRPAAARGVMTGMRPYNAEDYQLAYDVFVANRNLNDAYRVAAAAVHQVPNDMAWRERLAQISEWSNRYPEALEQWLYIARRTGRPNAWQAVLRLSPGIGNDEAMLEAMRFQQARGSLSDEQVRAVVDAYERMGRPRDAIEFLRQENARRPRPMLTEMQAILLERTGDIDGAIAAYRSLIQQSGPTSERVMTLATMLIVRGQHKEARDLLITHQNTIDQQQDTYWRLLADVALQLQERGTAERALGVLVQSGRSQPDDFNRLIQLLVPNHPESAARLAEMGYDRFGTTDYLILALGVYSQRRDWIGMRRVFAKMTPEVEAELAKTPDFLMLRASYRNATGHPDLARDDFREALRIDPNHKLARIGFMWFLIDRRELADLKRQLPIGVERARTDVDFEGVVGAAFVILGDPGSALAYLRKVLKRNPNDYLWLLNYADALEQNAEPDMAWRVRRHAWSEVRKEMAKIPPSERASIVLLRAHARLALTFTPGDESAAVMRNLLRQDQDLDSPSSDPLHRTLDAGTRDLVLAWLISSEQYIPAKEWLTRQYAKNIVRPTWAESLLATVENDTETMARLLDTKLDDIPRYDRHEAAMRTQQVRLAEDIAFTELEKRPHDDEMHLRLTNTVLPRVNSVEVGQTWWRRGVLDGREQTAEVGIWIGPRLRLSFDVTHIDQGILSPGFFAAVPANDTAYGLTMLYRHAIGDTSFSVFYREAFDEFAGFRLVHSRPLGPRLSGRIGLAYNDRALETSATSVAAVRDRIFANVQYTFSKREYLSTEIQASRYYTQGERTFIGSGHSLTWELGHRIRTEYPDLTVRAAGSFNHFNLSGSGDVPTSSLTIDGTIPTAGFFLPGSFSVYGVYAGFGNWYRTNYTRAIRPFADVGVSHNTVTGMGYSAILGASGSVVGMDRLTLYASTGRGGNGTNELSREVGLRYMYMFDRF